MRAEGVAKRWHMLVGRIAWLSVLAVLGGVAVGLGLAWGDEVFGRGPIRLGIPMFRTTITSTVGLLGAPLFVATAYHKHALPAWLLVYLPATVAGIVWA